MNKGTKKAERNYIYYKFRISGKESKSRNSHIPISDVCRF